MARDFNEMAEECLYNAMQEVAKALNYIRQYDKTWADHELCWELRQVYDILDRVHLSDYDRLI